MRCYEEFIHGPAGSKVYQDLEEAFIFRLNQDLEEEMKEIPHPHRAYVEVGQRMVVQKIKEISEFSQQLRKDNE